MAHLDFLNIMISDRGEEGYRIFGAINFTVGGFGRAFDIDTYIGLKTGDPKINAQLEEILLKWIVELHKVEKELPLGNRAVPILDD